MYAWRHARLVQSLTRKGPIGFYTAPIKRYLLGRYWWPLATINNFVVYGAWLDYNSEPGLSDTTCVTFSRPGVLSVTITTVTALGGSVFLALYGWARYLERSNWVVCEPSRSCTEPK